jgi:membrane protein DedA with SNARE-associated domain
LIAWITQYIEQFQYVAIAFVLFLAGLGVPIPEDIPLIYGGVMSGAGKMNVYIHFAVSMVFILVGDVCLYFIGRRISQNAETPSKWQKVLTPKRQAKVQGYFDRYGSWAVFFGRFVAGIRGAVYLTAGMARFPLLRFILLDFLAALISVPVWIVLGYWAGKEWETVIEHAKSYQVYILIGLGVIILGVWIAAKRRALSQFEGDLDPSHESAETSEVAPPSSSSDSTPS